MSSGRERKKFLFIVNRTAGTGSQNDIVELIAKAGEQNGVDCVVEFTTGPGHAFELSQAAVEGAYDCVVAVGGDGTSNEVARGLVHTAIPMGIIPAGSGNGLARHLGISLNAADAIKQVFSNSTLFMDTFTINGMLSLNVSGIGFDGHVTSLFGVKSKRGLLGYIRLAVGEFLKFNEFPATIVTGQGTLHRSAFIIAIANSSQYGNNARIAPMASVTDGMLHLNIVKKIPFYRLDFLYHFFTGTLERSSFCEIMQLSCVQMKTDVPIVYHVDGEPRGSTSLFEIKLNPLSLCVLAPLSRQQQAVR